MRRSLRRLVSLQQKKQTVTVMISPLLSMSTAETVSEVLRTVPAQRASRRGNAPSADALRL
jgi:hypothetical protein